MWLMMMQAQKPTPIMAGNFVELNFATFSKVNSFNDEALRDLTFMVSYYERVIHLLYITSYKGAVNLKWWNEGGFKSYGWTDFIGVIWMLNIEL